MPELVVRCVEIVRARFHIDSVFSVEGRGTVLQGTIVEGKIAAGMSVAVPGLSDRLVIGDIGAIHGRKIPLGSLGLVLREVAVGGPEQLRPFAEGKTVDIE